MFVIAFAALWFVGKLVFDLVAGRRARQLAAGAKRALPAAHATGVIGTVITNQPAAAQVVELSHRHGTMLYDAATVGFEIVLPSGERVRVPSGTCTLDGSSEANRWDVARYLGERFPLPHTESDPFPFEEFRMCTLRPGDRVEILSPLVPQAESVHTGGYRDAFGTVLTPVGIPRLRKVDNV